MTNSPENYPGRLVEELRSAILSKALSTIALTGRREQADTVRHLEILPEADDIPSFRISTFEEGSQDDGAILQVSLETYEIKEAHLVVKDDGMEYEEHTADGGHFSPAQVDDATAARLLDILSPIIKN